MGLFDEVKQNVTVRQAAERYGLKPNRSGLIRCIFHNDKSPSMKVDRRYYCFGCGCTGDAIDFTAQLFDIGLKDAAMKLADDFGIPYSGRDRGSPQNRRSVSAKKPEPTPEELWQKKHHASEVVTSCTRVCAASLRRYSSLPVGSSLRWRSMAFTPNPVSVSSS